MSSDGIGEIPNSSSVVVVVGVEKGELRGGEREEGRGGEKTFGHHWQQEKRNRLHKRDHQPCQYLSGRKKKEKGREKERERGRGERELAWHSEPSTTKIT